MRARGKEVLDELRGSVDEVLAVVDEKQGGRAVQCGDEQLEIVGTATHLVWPVQDAGLA